MHRLKMAYLLEDNNISNLDERSGPSKAPLFDFVVVLCERESHLRYHYQLSSKYFHKQFLVLLNDKIHSSTFSGTCFHSIQQFACKERKRTIKPNLQLNYFQIIYNNLVCVVFLS